MFYSEVLEERRYGLCMGAFLLYEVRSWLECLSELSIVDVMQDQRSRVTADHISCSGQVFTAAAACTD